LHFENYRLQNCTHILFQTRISDCSGLCTVVRSEAGNLSDNPRQDERAYLNNQHIFDVSQPGILGGPSNHVGYYDAASLYPSSGKPAPAIAALRAAGNPRADVGRPEGGREATGPVS